MFRGPRPETAVSVAVKVQNPTERFVMRGVPHSLSLATSITRPTGDPNPPEDRTGWSGDGVPNPGSFKEFLFGAIFQHFPQTLARQFPNDFRMPTDKELEKTEEFSLNSGRLFDVDIQTMSLTEPRAKSGRVLFGNGNNCDQCHNDAGADIGGSNPNIDTAVEMLVNPAQGFNGITFPLDGGFGGADEVYPNFDSDGDLVDDCFGDGEFNVTPVIEAADTPPFFHNNVVQTVEGSVQFYNGRFGINFSLADINDVGAFMRVINAAFNFQIAIQRVEAVLIIDPEADTAPTHAKFVAIRGTANRLLDLACAEIVDALDVLGNSPVGALNPSSIGAAEKARAELEDAIRSTNTGKRQTLMLSARQFLISADDGLGTGMDYLFGLGNLLF